MKYPVNALVNEMVKFVGLADSRIAELQSRIVQDDPLGRHGAGIGEGALSDSVFEGPCLELIREIDNFPRPVGALPQEFGAPEISEIRYLLAAWTDEAMIKTFQTRLPESMTAVAERQLFGTMVAGEQVFIRIDRILARRSQADLLLAPLYLLALSLGFRGQFASDQTQSLFWYRDKLMGLVVVPGATRSRGLASTGTSAQQERVDQKKRGWRPLQYATPRRLVAVLIAIWLLGVAGMEVIHHHESAPLVRKLDAVSRGDRAGAGPAGWAH